MNYYYGSQQATPPSNGLVPPSPTNLDISCIVDPVGSKGGIYVGNITAASNNELLAAYGIRAVLTSAMEANLTPDKNITPSYLKLEALDYPAFSLDQFFDQATEFIHVNVAVTNVLVHCMAGVSRSVSFVIAYLIKYRGMTFDGGLALLKNRRSIANPNSGFVKQLQDFESFLRGLDKDEEKRRKKIEKMLKNHHPALNTSQENSLKNSKVAKREKSKSKAKHNKSVDQSSVLRSSQAYNQELRQQATSVSKIPSQQNLYMSQATKGVSSALAANQSPARPSAPVQPYQQQQSQTSLAGSQLQQSAVGQQLTQSQSIPSALGSQKSLPAQPTQQTPQAPQPSTQAAQQNQYAMYTPAQLAAINAQNYNAYAQYYSQLYAAQANQQLKAQQAAQTQPQQTMQAAQFNQQTQAYQAPQASQPAQTTQAAQQQLQQLQQQQLAAYQSQLYASQQQQQYSQLMAQQQQQQLAAYNKSQEELYASQRNLQQQQQTQTARGYPTNGTAYQQYRGTNAYGFY